MGRRNTFMAGRAPYHALSRDKEAAKHLANVARRYVQERAGRAELEEAWRMFEEASPQKKPKEGP